MSMSASVVEREIKSGGSIYVVQFMPDGKHLVSGGPEEIHVWRLEDGQQVATLAGDARCLAVSNDGRWIAAGTRRSGAHVWSAETYEQLRLGDDANNDLINTVDFSPDSTQLVTTTSERGHTATIWDVATWNTTRTLKHSNHLLGAAYSPQGDKVATFTTEKLQIWDSKNGDLLIDVPVSCSWYSRGPAWVNNLHLLLFIDTSRMVLVKLGVPTGFTFFQWAVSCGLESEVALSQHGMFFAYSADDTVTICDTSTPTVLGVIKACKPITSISFSPDDQFVAISGMKGTIAVKHLPAVLETTLLVDSSTPTPLLREWVKSMLTRSSWQDTLAALINFVGLRFVLYRVICDHFEIHSNMADAVKCFHQMNDELVAQMSTHHERTRWGVDFRQRCLEKLPSLGDTAMSALRLDEAIIHYSAALSLSPALPQGILVKRSQAYMAKGLWEDALDDTNQVIKLDPQSPWNHESVLSEWVKVNLTVGPWKNTLAATSNFKVPRLTVYKILCEHLEASDRITDATECLHEMISELEQEIESNEAKQILSDFLSPRHRLRLSDRAVLDFKSRSCKELEDHGDAAMTAKRYEKAVSLYSVALGLDPPSPQNLFVKRSKAHVAKGMWEDAINDANEAITLDPISLAGYEQKYLALCGTGRYQDALYAFETLLAKMSESLDADVRERCLQYKSARKVVRRAVQDTIRELPRVLINADTGSLCDKTQQAAAFESLPIFTELISSTTAYIDQNRIVQEVTKYYRYAMLSHRWEDFEPLYEKVVHVTVYDLEVFPTHHKLQMFCKSARDAGFHWAWSDTCCINKADHFVLQEALVSMFNWYRDSSLTVVFLRGVSSPSKHGDLVRSIWNSRIWTFQEYHASKVVRFYNEDWTVYRNLDVPNHKESPAVISEMEEATGISADALLALQPGLANIREKLCLASRRETTMPEDAAYALFGIFSVSLPVIYGERDHAIGRFLAQLLANSGDTSILAWTGRTGSFNSCFPAGITVFSELPTTHIPLATNDAEVNPGLRTSPNMSQLIKLHDELLKLSAPLFSGKRMRLPCIAFRLGRVSTTVVASERVFCATTPFLGHVEIHTTEQLSRLDSLILVHPWIDFLLDRRPMEDVEDTDADADKPTPLASDAIRVDTVWPVFLQRLFGGSLSTVARHAARSVSLASATPDVHADALQFLARLRQPFGGLLLAPTRRNMNEYRRVAAEGVIRVQIRTDAPLDELVANVCTLDVL
ncbi:hypothetical protein JVU11DRAFT_9607 [Chiua virens]|nr:hypothetical protein JVU11DRAFT_9607 [Chiua virens]